MCKVSVIIPVYMVEEYLPACLDSVLTQTLEDIEIICIDDASPDRCPQILDAYAGRDGRIRVIHLQENHRQGYGRNRGLERASGKYVYFLDSDDMITPDAMEALYQAAEKEELDGIFFDSQVIFEEENLKKHFSGYQDVREGKYEDQIYLGKDLLDAFISQQEWNVYVQREFWNRDFLIRNDLFFPEGIEHEDELFAFEAILLADRVRYLAERYFIRRYRRDSVMTRKAKPRDFYGYFVSYYKMIEFVESRGLSGRGIDSNIVHVYERALQFYPVFVSQEDPKRWLRSEEEKIRYQFFMYSQKMEQYYQDKLSGFADPIPKVAHVWIYGAGIIGKRVWHVLSGSGYLVDGFLVTRAEGNASRLFGRPVKALHEVKASPDRIAVIAVSEGYQEEIKAALKARGWEYRVFPIGR